MLWFQSRQCYRPTDSKSFQSILPLVTASLYLRHLAVPIDAYSSFFTIRLVQNIIRIHQLKLIVYNPETEEIVEWIK
ncbi:element excision factor XisH family protein [Nostoc sp. CCY0012]|uniref:element excision factor XisH family protein n=1 Tax=Nostoc sp. CCY0012 TaxID=1056123 RepID=UPI0039C72194